MASIRQRKFQRKNGKISVYWQVSYYDEDGQRHIKQFNRQSKANSYRIKVEGELETRSHIPDKATVTVGQAADKFLLDFEAYVKAGTREQSTYNQYKSHVENHIKPAKIGTALVAHLDALQCQEFVKELSKNGVTDTQAAKIMTTLRMIVSFSEINKWIKGNPARAVRVRRQTRKVKRIRIPPKEDVLAILEAAEATGKREHAFVCLGFFCGLRPSELRGLPKTAIKGSKVTISQRADQWGKIGNPKTRGSTRDIDMGDYTAKVVAAWIAECPHEILFSSGTGKPENHSNLVNRLWRPLYKKAGLCKEGDKKPYKHSLHDMRHVAASLWIEQEKKPKKVQALLGHSSLQMTMDTYGHLWPDDEEDKKTANSAEQMVLAAKKKQTEDK